ncbi:hypothetical protein F2P81_012481 [Scophthalmus maximus]|uniref:Dedicator of cytokinesis N-terminal domain-containing protein n=1 Tax=Scophthalmus maximus TaxID=52904 RepID=A0A6A4SKS3_SCOMX|nr:hypothetical protein F2P81_012481 [Scophthalmus maximus]
MTRYTRYKSDWLFHSTPIDRFRNPPDALCRPLAPAAVGPISCFILRPHETVVPLEDPIATEVTSTLQEWALLWKQLYVNKLLSDMRFGPDMFLNMSRDMVII